MAIKFQQGNHLTKESFFFFCFFFNFTYLLTMATNKIRQAIYKSYIQTNKQNYVLHIIIKIIEILTLW